VYAGHSESHWCRPCAAGLVPPPEPECPGNRSAETHSFVDGSSRSLKKRSRQHLGQPAKLSCCCGIRSCRPDGQTTILHAWSRGAKISVCCTQVVGAPPADFAVHMVRRSSVGTLSIAAEQDSSARRYHRDSRRRRKCLRMRAVRCTDVGSGVMMVVGA
jgi:hypothetical protein